MSALGNETLVTVYLIMYNFNFLLFVYVTSAGRPPSETDKNTLSVFCFKAFFPFSPNIFAFVCGNII